MKSIHLKNFQCFKDSNEIPLHPITIFIGENDSGKSAILKALDIFLNNKPPTTDIFHRIHDDIQKICEIQIKFHSLHRKDQNFPRSWIMNDEVTVKKIFSLDDSYLIQPQEILIKSFIFLKSELNDITSLKASQLKEITTEFGLEYSTVKDSQIALQQFVQEKFTDLPKREGWARLEWNELSSYLPNYEYYNSASISNPLQLVSNTLKSVYRTYFYDINEQEKEILKEDLLDKKRIIIEDLDSTIQNELKVKIQEKNNKIQNISGDYQIDFSSGFQLSSLQADFGQGLRDISSIGEGSKKRLFLAITEWDKEIRSKKAYKKVIRGYDEPDTSLHYKAQKEMFFVFKSLSEQNKNKVQTILCTHSLSMIDRAPPRIINHIVQKNGVSHVEYLHGDEDQDIKEFLDNISDISGITNSSLFFERCFLIVEGETEFNALPGLYKKLTLKSLHEDGVVLVNIEGNGSWKHFLKLLNKNKQNATLIFLDSDIQEDGRRSLTPQGLREVGFREDFISTNVIFVGIKEFEDVFSDELLVKYLNKFHPKVEGEEWNSREISDLRGDGKFSDKIKNIVGRYQFEKGIRNRDFKKSEFGIRISELITPDEIQNIEAIQSLVHKISQIVH